MANHRISLLKDGFIICIICILFVFPFYVNAQEPKKGNEFDNLVKRLIQDGLQKEKLAALFAKETVLFTTNGVNTFFSYSESAQYYHKFLEKKVIGNAKKYALEHKAALDAAEKAYGVDKPVITAILLVETRLGTYLGKHNTLNILSTIASLDNAALREKIWNAIPKKERPNSQAFIKKVKKRSKWGYEELKALLKYSEQEKIEPDTLKGSFSGAIGICQFRPSIALRLARDGNNDGKIDLFTHEDAIFSIANYLKHHGWNPGLSRQKQYDVIYTYNHSNYYADTIQKISDKLKG